MKIPQSFRFALEHAGPEFFVLETLALIGIIVRMVSRRFTHD